MPLPPVLAKIAKLTGATIDWLITGEETKQDGLSLEEVRLLRLYRGGTAQGKRDILALAIDTYLDATSKN